MVNDYIEAHVMLRPIVIDGVFYKGVVVTRIPEIVVSRFSDFKKYFLIISWTRWFSWSTSTVEDIYALPNHFLIDDFKRAMPGREYLVFGDSDTRNDAIFYPECHVKEYDIIFVSRIAAFKRHEFFIRLLYLFRKRYNKDLHVLAITEYPLDHRVNLLRILDPSHGMIKIFTGVFRRMLAEFYPYIIKYLYRKAIRDGLRIENITTGVDYNKMREYYNKSKLYVLVSRYEGTNRAAREAMLCDVPILIIKKSEPAIANVRKESGEACEDNLDLFAKKIIEMLGKLDSYHPRQCALELKKQSRERIWGSINRVQKYPGYPDMGIASEIRRKYADIPEDNYIDLNYFKHFTVEDIKDAREKFNEYV